MSYAVRRPIDPSRSGGQASADAPTTAVVLDYTCLFTHDLRRKQKRWQDGRLKFHTFNKRIMVYDDRGNFIGDSHWHSSETLDEGEELELDRGSAIVQVADCTGSREQDLTELLDKRAREVEQRRASAAARTTPARQTPTRSREGQAQPYFQLKHRPLSAVVPSPGPHGRAAIPDRSPFEARRAEAGAEQQPPAAKRRRVSVSPPSKKGFAQNLFGTKLTLSACPAPASTPPATLRLPKARSDARTEELAESQDADGNEGDDDVVMFDGPPAESHNPGAGPAQPRSGRAKVIPVVASRDTSWRPPSADTNADAATGNAPVYPPRNALLSSHVLSSAHSAAKARIMQREEADAGTGAAAPTMSPIRQDLSRNSHYVGEPADQRSRVAKSPENAPLPKRKEQAVRCEDAASRPLRQEQSGNSEKRELRTELRIKSRQKRGLLMMSEQVLKPRDVQAKRIPMSAESSASPEAKPTAESREVGRQSEASEAQNTTCSGSETGSRAVSALVDASSESDGPPVAGLPQRRRVALVPTSFSSDEEALSTEWRQRRGLGHEQESNDDGSDSQECRPVRARGQESRRKRATSEDESESLSEPLLGRSCRRSSRRKQKKEPDLEKPAQSGPRLTKMARKSVKSKEILGYMPPTDDHMVPALFAAAASRSAFGLNPRGAMAATTSAAGRLDGARAMTRSDAARSSLERDRNEANTGIRSAADADDAAAAAVRRPREPAKAAMAEPSKEAAQEQLANTEQDAFGGPRPRIQNPATRGKKAARKEDAAGHALQTPVPMEPAALKQAAQVKPKKDLASLPGFSRANGGAWSRHAQDLLGMSRPVGRTGGG